MKIQHLALILPALFLVACSSNQSKNQTDADQGSSISQNGIDNQYDDYRKGQVNQFGDEISDLEAVNTVYFGFNQYDLQPNYVSLLNRHAELLNSSPNTVITIEGHADERGTSEYNIALGERRAKAVRDYLQSRGVSSRQMNIVSFGKERPAVLGHTEAVYEKNRRAVLVY